MSSCFSLLDLDSNESLRFSFRLRSESTTACRSSSTLFRPKFSTVFAAALTPAASKRSCSSLWSEALARLSCSHPESEDNTGDRSFAPPFTASFVTAFKRSEGFTGFNTNCTFGSSGLATRKKKCQSFSMFTKGRMGKQSRAVGSDGFVTGASKPVRVTGSVTSSTV